MNYDPGTAAAASLTYDTHLDYFVADSTVECHRDHLIVGRHAVKVLSMKEPPAQTFAHMLGGSHCAARAVHRLPGMAADCRRSRSPRYPVPTSALLQQACLADQLRVVRDTRPEEMLVDDSAGATVRQLGDALTEIEVNGHFFGVASLTLVAVRKRTARPSGARLRKP